MSNIVMKKLFYIIATMSLLMVSCRGNMEPENEGQTGDEVNTEKLEGPITISADRDVIKADGTYAAKLTVMLMDNRGIQHDVTSDVEIYCEGNDTPIAQSDFKTTEEGEYVFYALRGFDISNQVTVKAVNGVPALPADPASESVDFRHRLLLVQHTGNKCPNCPKLMNILKRIGEDVEYSPLYHHVASHSYNEDDVAYSSSAQTLSKAKNVLAFYPMLSYNLMENSSNEDLLALEMKEETIRRHIKELHKDAASVGISASAAHVGNSIYANISLKSAETSKYRVAVWVLEDNIHSTQSGADASWQNIHDNCLRLMYGNSKNECIYGKSLGVVEAGQTKELIAAIEVEDNWIVENCEIVVLAVAAEGEYELLNCTVCDVDSSAPYDYL